MIFRSVVLPDPDGPRSAVTAPVAGLPTEHAEPGVETRVELWRRWGDTRRLRAGPYRVMYVIEGTRITVDRVDRVAG